MIKNRNIVLVLLFSIVFSSLFFNSTNAKSISIEKLEEDEEEIDNVFDTSKLDYRILHNGNYLNFPIKPKDFKDNDIILVPMRFILESAGYDVSWKDWTVHAKKDDYEISFDTKDTNITNENLNGNILIDYNFFNSIEDINLDFDHKNKTFIFSSNNHNDNDVYYYNLGKTKMNTFDDREIEYVLNGGISVPKTENNPLVIVLHGAHDIDKAEVNRFDLGFSYLLKELSKENYVAVSPNVAIQYSFEDGSPYGSERIDDIIEKTFLNLKKANSGDTDLFGVNLTNKIDFNNVILIGHSRSGQEIFKISNKSMNNNDYHIKGLIGVAPARMDHMDYTTNDIPFSIILPELDGDVDSLEGQQIFDDITLAENRVSQAQSIYLFGANHNAFNQSISYQDKGKQWYEGELEKISKEDQRQFLIDYTIKFIDTIINDKNLSSNIIADDNILFNRKALVSTYIPGEKVYLPELNKVNNITTNKAIAKNVQGSIFPPENTADHFLHPGLYDELPLLNIKWRERNSSATIELDPNYSTKNKENISIYMAQNSIDKLNSKKNQSFTITLKDKNGKTSNLLLDDKTPALMFHDGQVKDEMFTSFTPLNILTIPLDNFKGIDKNNISEIQFNFTENDSGSIMIRFIDFN